MLLRKHLLVYVRLWAETHFFRTGKNHSSEVVPNSLSTEHEKQDVVLSDVAPVGYPLEQHQH